MGRMTYRDETGRARLTLFGKQMYCSTQATADCICKLEEALQAQEPRVMTLEEVRQERICWIEDADDGMMTRLFPATMFGTGKYASGLKSYMFLAQKPWAVDVNNYEWWYIIADYEQTWRCWTSRPTDEQREAIPWLT